MCNLALQERDNTIPHTIPQPQVTIKSKLIWRNTLWKINWLLFHLLIYSPKGKSIQAHHHDGGWQDLKEYNYELDTDLACQAVDCVDPLGPVPRQDSWLQLCHCKICCEGQSQEEECYWHQAWKHGQVASWKIVSQKVLSLISFTFLHWSKHCSGREKLSTSFNGNIQFLHILNSASPANLDWTRMSPG